MLKATLSAAALVCTSVTAYAAPQGADPLNGIYTLGGLSAEFDSSCPSGSSVGLNSEYGTITFFANGTFTLNTTGTFICSAGNPFTFGGLESGVYTLGYDGALELDFDPSNPGTDTFDLQVSWDRSILLDSTTEAGAPNLFVAVRQSSGRSTADLNGDFAANALVQDVTGTGVQMTAVFGSIQFDGLGGFSTSTSERTVSSNGTSSTSTDTDTGTYQVLPNGQIIKYGTSIPVGQLSPDGTFGFSMDIPGATGELSLFVKKKGAAPTPSALDDDWTTAAFGGEHLFLPGSGEVAVLEATGIDTFDPMAGTFFVIGQESWLSNISSGLTPTSGPGNFTLAADGSMTLSEAGSMPATGWLAGNEHVAVLADLGNADSALIGITMRNWGPLDGDIDTISVVSGGVQNLAIRAGDANGGKPYFILGSGSGSYPGTPFRNALIPLNYDSYTLFTLNKLNQGPFTGTLGLLDANGKANAAITIPANRYLGQAGSSLISSVIVFDPPGFGGPIGVVSQPVPLSLTP